jgi:hypothetical protein
MKKKAPELKQVHHLVLKHLHPAHVEVEICRADELAQRRGLTSDLDAMWSDVGKRAAIPAEPSSPVITVSAARALRKHRGTKTL